MTKRIYHCFQKRSFRDDALYRRQDLYATFFDSFACESGKSSASSTSFDLIGDVSTGVLPSL